MATSQVASNSQSESLIDSSPASKVNGISSACHMALAIIVLATGNIESRHIED